MAKKNGYTRRRSMSEELAKTLEEVKTMLRRMEVVVGRRDTTISQQQDEIDELRAQVVCQEQEMERERITVESFRDSLGSFLFQGSRFEDAVRELITEKLDEERRRNSGW
jgi:hypothetical protein